MPKMPSMSSKELVRLLEKGGAVFVRQGSTAPSNPAISLDNITETASQVLTVTISVSDDTGITGYYLSESEAAPTAISDGWISIQTTTSYNSNVSFTLSSGNGNKTIYVWFMDGAGNISAVASTSITQSNRHNSPIKPNNLNKWRCNLNNLNSCYTTLISSRQYRSNSILCI